MRRVLFLSVCLLPALLAGCGDDGRTEVWMYTSIYERVIPPIESALQADFPDVSFQWLKAGSEQVAMQLNAELAAGHTSCDLLMTSDPFYYYELERQGSFLDGIVSPAPPLLPDPGQTFVTVRVPLMVIGVNHEHVEAASNPKTFLDLADPRFKGKVSMGDPRKSGTNFTTVAALAHHHGWELFQRLRENDLLSAGGNSSVLQRLETGERPVGIVLLENLLPAIARGAPLDVVYPEDGAIPVPSPVAIMASTAHPDLARQVLTSMFSRPVQDGIVSGHMYSPLPDVPPPAGARPWSELKLFSWDQEFVDSVIGHREEIKERFQTVMGL